MDEGLLKHWKEEIDLLELMRKWS